MPFQNRIEIMAPAGSFESLAAALQGGADSVYFGVGKLNMRSRATVNFSEEDLPEIVERCHEAGAKAYLTLNIIVYDEELEAVHALCDAARKAGVDAVIASDLAVISYARSIGLEVHMSVQANVCNMASVKFYAQYADVVVLARELTLAQIRHIIESIRKEGVKGPSGELLRVEIFAHGALCVAVSGKCHMSLAAYNSSANRGACFQNCRRAYRVTDEETGNELVIDNKYVMSPKDLCTIPVLDQLLDAGVSVLKLEGRGRSSDYVRTVTSVYREAARACQDGTFSADRAEAWMKRLESVFNRGFWQGGYYLGVKWGEWSGSANSRAALLKIHIARVENFYKKNGVAALFLEAGGLSAGQTILITGPTTGAVRMEVAAMRRETAEGMEPVEAAQKGETVYLAVPERVRRRDKVYLLRPPDAGGCLNVRLSLSSSACFFQRPGIDGRMILIFPFPARLGRRGVRLQQRELAEHVSDPDRQARHRLGYREGCHFITGGDVVDQTDHLMEFHSSRFHFHSRDDFSRGLLKFTFGFRSRNPNQLSYSFIV